MTRHYHVYGMGNAMVDIDFEISEQLLQVLDIEKSVMTLIDSERHDYLMKQLAHLNSVKASGGSCANTMIALSQFGGDGFYSCRVSDDTSGYFFLKDLKEQGVDSNQDALMKNADVATGKCLVFTTSDADRTMNTYLGSAKQVSPDQIDLTVLKRSHYLYIEGYLVSTEKSRHTAIQTCALAKQFGVKTAITLSDPNVTHHFRDGLLEIIGDGVDFIFCNEAEAKSFCRVDSFEETLPILKRYAKQFTITRGAQGAFIFDGEKNITVPACPIKPVDTLGAGDIYAAGILYGLTQHLPLTLAAELGTHAAAAVVQKAGPRLTLQESQTVFQKFMARHYSEALSG